MGYDHHHHHHQQQQHHYDYHHQHHQPRMHVPTSAPVDSAIKLGDSNDTRRRRQDERRQGDSVPAYSLRPKGSRRLNSS
ncbi:hypothetical protein EJ05DRAFT_472033 [Pseudovirgaria hyperparasitica]|uniref:Uncharacterized protein n=1 Tax=Pseudovirgaria hyperparasitica TaxID=470096 RepID=A0A6A6WLM7_9PEZI|nr:uncharacterized protein EJ05DRAFT_472033 [Pseudovirgaria hyperparasitica]KAF2763091.1 hypothetical protein EJ05DRAFT_472033 [Pseudovirgaria hyperparasitica]